MNFEPFPKIARLKRNVVVTEKIDGTNAQIGIFPIDNLAEFYLAGGDKYPRIAVLSGKENGDSPLAIFAGSRTRWLTPGKNTDNFGFAAWVLANAEDLAQLGEGRHYGEWWGQGIQRNYGLTEKRFSLFNVKRWGDHNPNTPACCHVVPVIVEGEELDTYQILSDLWWKGSYAAPGFDKPEGIVLFHSSSQQLYKVTLDGDGGKWREKT